ncbi:MAG: MBL fold metallo-hydrolase [Clostridia bacterium]|nr:MBL fold metallo-hydrolase [Clostridia bacterium]
MQVYFLDVGQASSTLVIFPDDKTMLIDTGSDDSKESLVEDLNLILAENNLSKIDLMILTHPDADHVGGTASVLNAFQVDNVLRPKVLAEGEPSIRDYLVSTTYTYQKAVSAISNEPNCTVKFVENNSWESGGAAVRIFAGDHETYSDTNSYSPFITVTFNQKTFLFTGDAPFLREEEFLNTLKEENLSLSVDFLQVAHHGSKNSTTEEFLQALDVKLAFISANSSTHPSGELLMRLENEQISYLCTKESGMIGVGVDESFVLCTLNESLDLPFIIVVLFCVSFCILKFCFSSQQKKMIYFARFG